MTDPRDARILAPEDLATYGDLVDLHRALAFTPAKALLASHTALTDQLAAAQATIGAACGLLTTVQDDDRANIPAWFRLRINDFLVKAARHDPAREGGSDG